MSLQKDTALLAVLGVVEAARAAQIYSAYRFNYSSFVVAAFLFILMTIPLGPADRLVDRTGSSSTASGGNDMTEAVRIQGVRKAFGELEVLRDIDLVVEDHEVIGSDRGERFREVDAVAVHRPPRAGRRRPHLDRGR